MALYLVRWPDLSCTLVTARDEDHLGYLLDEVGNPVGCCGWRSKPALCW